MEEPMSEVIERITAEHASDPRAILGTICICGEPWPFGASIGETYTRHVAEVTEQAVREGIRRQDDEAAENRAKSISAVMSRTRIAKGD